MIQTSQAGNQSGNAANNYAQTYYLPRGGLSSMISQLDVRVNGRSTQNISQYSYIYIISSVTGYITVQIIRMMSAVFQILL